MTAAILKIELQVGDDIFGQKKTLSTLSLEEMAATLDKVYEKAALSIKNAPHFTPPHPSLPHQPNYIPPNPNPSSWQNLSHSNNVQDQESIMRSYSKISDIAQQHSDIEISDEDIYSEIKDIDTPFDETLLNIELP